MTGTRILIFAKAPLAGQAKTRLIPALGADGAARLATAMLAETVAAALEADVGRPELCASPAPDEPEWAGLLPDGVDLSDQGEGDLGERLARASQRIIAGGEQVLLIGTDCPGLSSELLRAAAFRLRIYDAVIHPAIDGGYALLGLRRFDRSLFEGISWSTSTVTAETIACLVRLGWSHHVGLTLRDIDEPADLQWLPGRLAVTPERHA